MTLLGPSDSGVSMPFAVVEVVVREVRAGVAGDGGEQHHQEEEQIEFVVEERQGRADQDRDDRGGEREDANGLQPDRTGAGKWAKGDGIPGSSRGCRVPLSLAYAAGFQGRARRSTRSRARVRTQPMMPVMMRPTNIFSIA